MPLFLVSTSGTQARNHPTPTSVYRYSRNLAGVTGTVSVSEASALSDDPPLPFLGAAAMTYLQAHGYDTPSILHIATAYQNAFSVNDFALGLSSKGLPITEAYYIWSIIAQENQKPTSL
jgi:hypothetical protein